LCVPSTVTKEGRGEGDGTGAEEVAASAFGWGRDPLAALLWGAAAAAVPLVAGAGMAGLVGAL